jgi:hypothetical protein
VTFQGGLFGYLTILPAVTNLVGTRIFPVRAPDNTPTPYVVYKFADRTDLNSLTGPAPVAQARLLIDVYCADEEGRTAIAAYDLAWQVAEALRQALTYFQGYMTGNVAVQSILLERMDDADEPDLGMYEVQSEYSVMFGI